MAPLPRTRQRHSCLPASLLQSQPSKAAAPRSKHQSQQRLSHLKNRLLRANHPFTRRMTSCPTWQLSPRPRSRKRVKRPKRRRKKLLGLLRFSPRRRATSSTSPRSKILLSSTRRKASCSHLQRCRTKNPRRLNLPTAQPTPPTLTNRARNRKLKRMEAPRPRTTSCLRRTNLHPRSRIPRGRNNSKLMPRLQ